MGDTPTFSDALTAVRARVDAMGGIGVVMRDTPRLGALLLGTNLSRATTSVIRCWSSASGPGTALAILIGVDLLHMRARRSSDAPAHRIH